MTQHLNKHSDKLAETVRRAIECRRQVLVYEIARRLNSVLSSHTECAPSLIDEETTPWIPIESLSKLRTEVGGRFRNLKDRWLAAGFPLREHRGDRSGDAKLNYQGWMELASWIGSQGYEVRLADEREEFLFEVRKIPSASSEKQ